MVSIKLIVTILAALAISSCLAADDDFNCYKCDNCETVDDKTTTETCTKDKKCFIVGDEEKETWTRGCEVASFCDGKEKDSIKCSQCTDDKCNSARSFTYSLVMTTVAAMFLNYVR